MFKKPLGNLKTSAPIRSSDRRKLKQKVISALGITPEDGDRLVPDGILAVKFNTYLDEPGTAYLDPDGDPLWFSIGKGVEDLIPSVYTLWKKHDLLPSVYTPSSVVPVLIGGADLMIPGVIQLPPSLHENQLVSVCQFTRKDGNTSISAPIGVGRMALPSDQLQSGRKEKGKAVLMLHTWKDSLFDLGSKGDLPDGAIPQSDSEDLQNQPAEGVETAEDLPPSSPEHSEGEDNTDKSQQTSNRPTYSPQEVSKLLHLSLLQAILATLSSLPPSSFPIPSTSFYTNYILPARPAFPTLLFAPSSEPPEAKGQYEIDPQELTIKTSSHKSLTAFLKSEEKAGLLALKSPPKHSQHSDLMVTAIKPNAPEVVNHQSYVTIKQVEATAAKKAAREEKAREEGSKTVLELKELWKPHLASAALFEEFKADKHALYSLQEIKTLINSYISSHNLVNTQIQAYVNLDDALLSCISAKKTKSKNDSNDAALPEFMKREELAKKITEQMQDWYQVSVPGKDPLYKKGTLTPIQVVMKIRQGRKASTMITGFEPFLVIDADEMADELRKVCAGSTSVSPVVGKGRNLKEVLVQGKQSTAVVEYLTSKGIPAKWIDVSDLCGKK